MAYNPNVPAPTNRVQDDIAAMRENFQHLDPLAQAVGELQAVSGLAPYVQAILDSRIVEMGSNSNGTYVRWENGLQVCFGWVILFTGDGTSGAKSGTLPLPASFSADVALWAGDESSTWRAYQDTGNLSVITSSLPWRAERKSGSWSSGANYPIHFIAVGRWK